MKDTIDFENVFSKYLESKEADDIFNNFFHAVKKAYFAGIKAGRDEILKEKPTVSSEQSIINFIPLNDKRNEKYNIK